MKSTFQGARSGANSAHARQSGRASRTGSQTKFSEPFELFPPRSAAGQGGAHVGPRAFVMFFATLVEGISFRAKIAQL